jgi:GR25 family glycosyltransferase involved in LPS biosynthesis
MKYYLIHGIDTSRKQRMLNEFEKFGLDNSLVNWITGFNKYDLSDDFIKTIVKQENSYCCGVPMSANSLNRGQISCTYKHYLAIKNFVESGDDYGIIMEDNVGFNSNIPERVNLYIEQLNKYHSDWDAIFDFEWHQSARYIEGPLIDGIYVYPKTNEITSQCHGSTKCAQFYILTKKAAKILYNNYLPFNHAPDWYMNDLFRKFNMKVFWAEPGINIGWVHNSTATG